LEKYKIFQLKRRAIATLGFGLVNKLVLQFDRAFWPPECHSFARLCDTM
jgi:hypothetical protein